MSSQSKELRKMVKELGLEQSVTFVGFLQKEEYRQLLNSVDVLVMPSRDEAFGIVYIEAMALGKPIIAANCSGTPEVVEDWRNGILVELNPNKLAEAILCLYQNEDLRKKISQNNLQDAAKYDWNYIVNQYIDIYGDVIHFK